MNIPDTIGCAHCGKPLTWANSYGLSTPLTETRIKASDFCDLTCLAAWTADVADLATNRVKRN